MVTAKRKIINDPVYGFITIDNPLVFTIISHPYYQRLRRIHQMALAHLVYPGAVHTRLHHSLGAYHLMCQAIAELRNKGVEITPDESVAVRCGILLHDVGHGPFSHALEKVLIPGVSHEELSLSIMHAMNRELDGALQMTVDIFTGHYHKPFLHQLISGQLDVDRLDYLTRDSFYTGVSEGVVGYDRILKMLAVHDNELVVEEKGIHSVEKFLVARRQMYWQVYLHKTVLSAEMMLVKIIERARVIKAESVSPVLNLFLNNLFNEQDIEVFLPQFCQMDDIDVMSAVKAWVTHDDTVLSLLCRSLIDRKLYKCRFQAQPVDATAFEQSKQAYAAEKGFTMEQTDYLYFKGETANTTYQLHDERINILLKDGSLKDISAVDNPLIHQTLSVPVKKFYICQLL